MPKQTLWNFNVPARITATMGGDMWNDATGEPFIIEFGGLFFVGEVVATVQNGNKFIMTIENFKPMEGEVDDYL